MIKSIKIKFFIIGLVLMSFSFSLAAQFNAMDESPITASIVWLYGERVLKVSVNDIPEKEGRMVIYNDKSEVVLSSESIELIHAPNYTSFSASNFLPGNYKIEITTKIAKYQGQFTVIAE